MWEEINFVFPFAKGGHSAKMTFPMNGESGKLTVEARAKINLTLEILGKRPDGYHDLRSIVMPVSLCDTIQLVPTHSQIAMSLTVSPGVDVSHIGPMDRIF